MVDLIAITISIIALIISIVSPAFEYWWNTKINTLNLESQYFMTIYGKYIMEDLPNAREHIHFNNNKLSGTDEVVDVLRNIRKSSIFFKCYKTNFYSNLISSLQTFEDFLVMTETTMSNDQFADFHSKCNTYIDNIYVCINNAYLGKKK